MLKLAKTCKINFNSHAHVERDNQNGIYCGIISDFNSHAHVERDMGSKIKPWNWSISTHTLTWSVTFTWGNLPDTIDISTHTLTWSVTIALAL